MRADLIDTMMLRPLGVLTASLGFLLMSASACWFARTGWAFAWLIADLVLLKARVVPAWIAWRTNRRVPYRTARIIILLASVMFATFGVGCAFSFATGIQELQLAATMAVMALFTGLAIRWAALPRLSIAMHVIVGAPMACALAGINAFVFLLFAVLAIGSIVLTVQNNRTLLAVLAAKRQAQQLARTDVLTQLVNRAGLDIELERLAATSTRSVSLLFLDLDGFKGINDHYGHAAGDRVLVEIGARLRAVAGEKVVARLGGDEFVIVLPDAGAQSAEAMAAAARHAITHPIHLRDQGALVSVGVSLGCASGSLAVDGAARLLADADAALYAAKRRRHRQAARPAAPRNAA
ncbi:MAG: sensor domain-containing diguanylate cyclase [Sphingomonadaceae bacterium]|nr:MAG: sensor domain-containing diguanylate cyclase [Sphingomonadaceae bacterium]